MKITEFHFAFHMYMMILHFRAMSSKIYIYIYIEAIYCPDVVGGWVWIGDFVRVSFFLSQSQSKLSFCLTKDFRKADLH